MRLIIVFIVFSSCIFNENNNVEISEIFNNDKSSFNEFKKKIINYANQSKYPDINE
tara:strand:- start:1885 stop:2052 length:168 start_codon:yes stop_codon:yes gene_type:complete